MLLVCRRRDEDEEVRAGEKHAQKSDDCKSQCRTTDTSTKRDRRERQREDSDH